MLKITKKDASIYQHCAGERTHNILVDGQEYGCFFVDNLYGYKKVIGLHVDYPTESEREILKKYAFKINSDDRFSGRYWFYIDAHKIL